MYICICIYIKAELRDLKKIFESDLKDAEMQAGLAVAEAEEHFGQVGYLIPVHEYPYMCIFLYLHIYLHMDMNILIYINLSIGPQGRAGEV
jgi:hypothetical protein